MTARVAPTDGGWDRPALTWRAPLLVVAVGAVLGAWPYSVVVGTCAFGAIALGLVVADYLLAVRPAHVGVERDMAPVVELDRQMEISWRVTNPGARPVRVAFSDQLAPSLRASARGAVVAVAPKATVTATATLVPARRGRFNPRRLVVRVEGPMRLAARQSARDLPGELKVYPAFGSRREAELRLDRARIVEQGMRAARSRGGATLFEQLREYSVDDDSRRIDWAATARASRPIVRTYRAERNQRVLCLVDSGRTMAGQVAGVARLEHAIDAVMMLTSVASRLGDMPGVVAFDSVVRASVPLRSGASQLKRVTEALYQLQPRLVATDYRGALAEVLGRAQRRALLCLITELDEALADTLFPMLGLIAREHVLIVAAVTDPDVATWATGGDTGDRGDPGDRVEAAYRAAAALLAQRRRRELAHHLRSAGALVVDAPPGRLAPALTDAYLDIKAAGRL